MTDTKSTAAQQDRQNHRDGNGKYTEYQPTAAAAEVTAALVPEYDELDDVGGEPIDFEGEGSHAVHFRPSELGGDDDVVMSVDVTKLNDGDFIVEGIREFSFLDFTPDGMTAATWLTKLDRKQPAALTFLERRYGAVMDLPDFEEETEQIRFIVNVERPSISREQAFAAVWDRTGAVQFHNESDHGTTGSLNLGRLLNEELDNCIILDNRFDYVHAAADITDDEALLEVRARFGTDQEVEDATAIACARRLAYAATHANAELRRLVKYGWCNAERLSDELFILHGDPIRSDDNLRVNMLGTWLINKRNASI